MFFNTMMMGTMGFQYNFPTLPTETTFLGTSSNLVTADYAQMNVSNGTDQVANFGQGLFYVLEHHNGNSRYFRTTVSANSTSYTTHNLPRAAFSGISTVGGSGPVGDIFYYSNGTTIYEYDHSTSSDTGTTYTAGVDHDCFVISDPVVYLADYDSTQDEVTVHARRWPGMQPIKSVVVSNTLSASQFRAMDITIDSSGLVLFTDYSGNVYGVDFNLETSFVVDDDGVGQSIGISYDPALDSVFILRANSPNTARFYERQVSYFLSFNMGYTAAGQNKTAPNSERAWCFERDTSYGYTRYAWFKNTSANTATQYYWSGSAWTSQNVTRTFTALGTNWIGLADSGTLLCGVDDSGNISIVNKSTGSQVASASHSDNLQGVLWDGTYFWAGSFTTPLRAVRITTGGSVTNYTLPSSSPVSRTLGRSAFYDYNKNYYYFGDNNAAHAYTFNGSSFTFVGQETSYEWTSQEGEYFEQSDGSKYLIAHNGTNLTSLTPV